MITNKQQRKNELCWCAGLLKYTKMTQTSTRFYIFDSLFGKIIQSLTDPLPNDFQYTLTDITK